MATSSFKQEKIEEQPPHQLHFHQNGDHKKVIVSETTFNFHPSVENSNFHSTMEYCNVESLNGNSHKMMVHDTPRT